MQTLSSSNGWPHTHNNTHTYTHARWRMQRCRRCRRRSQAAIASALWETNKMAWEINENSWHHSGVINFLLVANTATAIPTSSHRSSIRLLPRSLIIKGYRQHPSHFVLVATKPHRKIWLFLSRCCVGELVVYT